MTARMAYSALALGLLSAAGTALYCAGSAKPGTEAPPDSALQSRQAALAAATPEALAQIEDRLSTALARLPDAAGADALIRGACGNWIVESYAADRRPAVEIRRYVLARRLAGMGAWPDILETVRLLSTSPGLTIDALNLAVSPANPDAFQQAEIRLTLRVRKN